MRAPQATLHTGGLWAFAHANWVKGYRQAVSKFASLRARPFALKNLPVALIFLPQAQARAERVPCKYWGMAGAYWPFEGGSWGLGVRRYYSQSYGFSSSHVQMWELDHQEGWMLNNWCFWTVVLEKTLHSPLDSKERKPVNLKEINAEYSLQELILRLKLQYCGHLMWRANSLKKTLILGKIEGRRRSG